MLCRSPSASITQGRSRAASPTRASSWSPSQENFRRARCVPIIEELRENLPARFRLGWPKHFFFDRLDDEVRRSVEATAKVFQQLGAEIHEISLPRVANSVEEATAAVVAEANRYHESQGYFPARAQEYGEDVRGHLEFGHKLLAVDYLRALDAKREMEQDFAVAFEKVDAIIAPTSPITRPAHWQTRNPYRRPARNARSSGVAAADSPRQSHRPSSNLHPLRLHPRRFARRLTANRPALGRSAAPLHRPRLRTIHRLAFAPPHPHLNPPFFAARSFGAEFRAFAFPRGVCARNAVEESLFDCQCGVVRAAQTPVFFRRGTACCARQTYLATCAPSASRARAPRLCRRRPCSAAPSGRHALSFRPAGLCGASRYDRHGEPTNCWPSDLTRTGQIDSKYKSVFFFFFGIASAWRAV